MIQRDDKKQGRNETCGCGSNLKYKHCCGKQHDPITVGDMVKCLYLLLDGAAKGPLMIPPGPVPFSRELLAKVPKDVAGNLMVADDDNFIVLTVKQPKKSVIIQADKTLTDSQGRDLKLSS